MRGLQAQRGTHPLGGYGRLMHLYRRLSLVAAAVIAVDQTTKSLALAHLETPREVISGWLTLRILYNPGGAFGILQGMPELFLVASLVAAVVILVWVRHIDRPGWSIPLGLVLGGGLGNLSDRVLRDTDGRVVDFIDIHVWPVFNVADACIVMGVISVLILGAREKEGEPEAEQRSSP